MPNTVVFYGCIRFQVDCYGTVQPHTLIRQHLDYGHWYDRTKLSLKDIHNCQYVSCMNPTAGSFTINPRLQRHFCVIAVRYNKPFIFINSKIVFLLSSRKKLCVYLIRTVLTIYARCLTQLFL